MRILLIDNFDSFTYNLVAVLEQINCQVQVIRNDDLKTYKTLVRSSEKIIISPGPSNPAKSKLSLDAIDYSFHYDIPLLGICLGHQAIGYYFGEEIIKASKPVHGKISEVIRKDSILWQDIPKCFEVTRYHSLLVKHNLISSNLEILAETKLDKLIMALGHKQKPIFGIQFHPESVTTQYGELMISNFIYGDKS